MEKRSWSWQDWRESWAGQYHFFVDFQGPKTQSVQFLVKIIIYFDVKTFILAQKLYIFFLQGVAEKNRSPGGPLDLKNVRLSFFMHILENSMSLGSPSLQIT